MVTASKYWHSKLNIPGISERGLSWLHPLIVACCILAASMLPWLSDPLGTIYFAWNITIDVAWFGHMALLNYGLLCLISAVSVLAIVSRNLRYRSHWTHAYVA